MLIKLYEGDPADSPQTWQS